MGSEISDNALKNLTRLPDTPAPQEVSSVLPPSKLERVTRPLRHVKYIPTKQLVFYSKNKKPQFTYDIKIKIPIKSNQVVVQVKAVGLNPVDLKIINSYTSNFNSERGIGREYSGIITHVGSKYISKWKEGDEVCGIYFHANGYGALASSIVIDPSVDGIVKKPTDLSFEASGSWLWTFGTAWQLLQNTKNIGRDSSVFINGGSSSVGLMVIQLLKNYYNVENITASTSESGKEVAVSAGAKLTINYKTNPDLPKVLELLTTTGVYKDYDNEGNPIERREIPASKFDLIVDLVGGYNLVYSARKYLKSSATGAFYITTVGDEKFNYRKDIYNDWNSPYVSARSKLGGLWSLNYLKFNFNPRSFDWLQTGVDLLNNGEVVVYIDSIFDWKSYNEASQKLRSGHAHGKIVLQVETF